MAFTITSPFGKRLAEKLEPWLTEDLERYSDAIGTMFDPFLELAEETGSDGEAGFIPNWGKLLDATLCPTKDLGYLGQFVGVEIPVGTSEAEARALVKAESGLERGTTASIEAACRRILGPGVEFNIEERTNIKAEEDAYHFLVIVTPGKGSTALTQAITAVKPGGVLFSIIEVEGAWIVGEDTWEGVAPTVTWENVKEGEY